jgi:hypothetical protein
MLTDLPLFLLLLSDFPVVWLYCSDRDMSARLYYSFWRKVEDEAESFIRSTLDETRGRQ